MLHVSISHCMPEKNNKTSKSDNSCLFVWRTVQRMNSTARVRIKVGWPGQQYGRQIQKTEKPRERTKALLGIIREVLAPKNHIYGQLRGAVAQRYTFSA